MSSNPASKRDYKKEGAALLMAEGCREWRRQLNGYMADGETGIRHVGNPDTGPLVTDGAKWVPPRKYAVRITSPIVVEAKEARLAAQHVVDTLYPYSMTLEDVTTSDYVEGATSDALMAKEQLATATETAHARLTVESSFVGDCDLCGQWADPLVAGVCRECALKGAA